jgi:hypothetical protein
MRPKVHIFALPFQKKIAYKSCMDQNGLQLLGDKAEEIVKHQDDSYR